MGKDWTNLSVVSQFGMDDTMLNVSVKTITGTKYDVSVSHDLMVSAFKSQLKVQFVVLKIREHDVS